MPTYLYICEKKHGEFEEFHSMSIKLEFCPECEKEGTKTEVKRLISPGGSRGVVELTGQDLVNSVKQDAQRIQNEASRDAKKYANLIGEAKYEQIQQRMDKQRR